MSIDDAATHAGLTVKGYKAAVRRKLYPGPMCDPVTGAATNRYDLRAIDLAMDRMSGIVPDGVSGKPAQEQSAFEKWKASFNESGTETRSHGQEEAR